MATESDKLNIGAIATLVAVLTLTMVAIVAVLTAMVRNEVDAEVQRKGGLANDKGYRNLAAAQSSELTEGVKWVDQDAGVLSIPIDRSMKIVVDEIRREPELATATPADAGAPEEAEGAGGAGPTGAEEATEEATEVEAQPTLEEKPEPKKPVAPPPKVVPPVAPIAPPKPPAPAPPPPAPPTDAPY